MEDAELCERKASAIKMLTRAAVKKQMAETPMHVLRDRDAEVAHLTQMAALARRAAR